MNTIDNKSSDESNIVLNESRSSVKLKISTKGITTFEVKVYNEKAEEASQEAEKIFNELKRKYLEEKE